MRVTTRPRRSRRQSQGRSRTRGPTMSGRQSRRGVDGGLEVLNRDRIHLEAHLETESPERTGQHPLGALVERGQRRNVPVLAHEHEGAGQQGGEQLVRELSNRRSVVASGNRAEPRHRSTEVIIELRRGRIRG